MTPPDPTDADVLKASGSHWATSVGSAVHVISTERAALANLEHLYQTNFLAQEHLARAVSQIASSIRNGGKLVCCGVGKSGLVGQKMVATKSVSLRPYLSLKKVERIEPSKDPPAILAVIPPCSMASGL